jgi:catechol 2,3-dioxygenase-like lactoylglutathione lyase family enzyme
MKTSNDRKMTAGVVLRVSLAGCMILACVGLVLGLYPARTTAQPGPSAPKSEGAAGKRLNHIDLVVPKVAEDRAFFEKYFGFRRVVDRGDKLVVLTDGAGFALTLSSPETGAEIDQFQRDLETAPKDKDPAGPYAKKPVEYPKGFHIGFMQDSREKVDEIYKQLKDGGVTVEPPREYHGAWTFFVRAPGGFFVEVFHQSRRGTDGSPNSTVSPPARR